jgi:hypothetical protein
MQSPYNYELSLIQEVVRPIKGTSRNGGGNQHFFKEIKAHP